MQENKPYNVNKGLILIANNHFAKELVNPVCPRCGFDRVTKQDYRRRRPILGEFGAQTVYLKRYRCKRCRKKFTTPLDSVVERNHRYASVFEAKVNGLTKTGYHTVRCGSCGMISPPSSASRLHFTPDDKELAGNR